MRAQQGPLHGDRRPGQFEEPRVCGTKSQPQPGDVQQHAVQVMQPDYISQCVAMHVPHPAPCLQAAAALIQLPAGTGKVPAVQAHCCAPIASLSFQLQGH